MNFIFETQLVVQQTPHYDHICNFNKAEDRYYFCELINITAEELNMDLFFAPIGVARQEQPDGTSLVAELFLRTNRMPNQEDMETIFDAIQPASKPNDNVPFGIMAYANIYEMHHCVFDGTEMLDSRSFNFDLYNAKIDDEDFRPSPFGPNVNNNAF